MMFSSRRIASIAATIALILNVCQGFSPIVTPNTRLVLTESSTQVPSTMVGSSNPDPMDTSNNNNTESHHHHHKSPEPHSVVPLIATGLSTGSMGVVIAMLVASFGTNPESFEEWYFAVQSAAR